MTQQTITVEVDRDLEDLVPGFLRNRENDVNSVRAAVAAGDLETTRRIGHTMKGSGGGYGFDFISQVGEDIETGAVDGDPEAIARALERLVDYLERLEVRYV